MYHVSTRNVQRVHKGRPARKSRAVSRCCSAAASVAVHQRAWEASTSYVQWCERSAGSAKDHGQEGKKKSPWREGKGPKKGFGHKKPSTGEAQKNKSFFEARKAGKAGANGGVTNWAETICLCCREKGHRAKHCPKNTEKKFVPKHGPQSQGRKGRYAVCVLWSVGSCLPCMLYVCCSLCSLLFNLVCCMFIILCYFFDLVYCMFYLSSRILYVVWVCSVWHPVALPSPLSLRTANE